jgi:hypothetical protein
MSSDDNQEEPMTSDFTYQSEPMTYDDSSALITTSNETTLVLPTDTVTVIPADTAAKVTEKTQTVITKSTRMLSYTQTVTSRQSASTPARFVDQSNLLFHLLNGGEVTGDRENSITENISRDADTPTVTAMMLSKVIWFLGRVGMKQTRIDFTVLLLHAF